MPKLLNAVRGYPVISLVGNAKNAGKTTVLNALISQMPDADFAVTSIGLDGEALDAVTRLPKPRIHLPAGCLVATAEELLWAAQCEYEMIERSGVATGLGDILIARVTKPGICLVGGPSTVPAMEAMVERLRFWGAKQVLIDGAFARSSHAAAGDAFIYIVGAHQSPQMARVLKSAEYALRRFLLPEVPPALSYLRDEIRPGYLDNTNHFHPIQVTSAMGLAGPLLGAVPPQARALFLPGAAGPLFLSQYIKTRGAHGFGLILKNPLAIVAPDSLLRHLFLMKRDIRVLWPLTLCLLAANPFSPAGYSFSNDDFLRALKDLSPVPVLNVMEDATLAKHK